MSDTYGTDATSGYGADATGRAGVAPTDASVGTIDTAKHEAGALKDVAADEARDVVGTAKEEASAVLDEAKTQAKDLYAQTRRELMDQANTQQQRLATGLGSVSDDLRSMASSSTTGGVASDLVRQASRRLSHASMWLGDRDPHSVLAEVKRYARRKPGMFILGAAVAGLVAGRLTRALASQAADHTRDANANRAFTGGDSRALGTTTGAPAPVQDTPIYAQSTAAREGGFAEDGDDRFHTV